MLRRSPPSQAALLYLQIKAPTNIKKLRWIPAEREEQMLLLGTVKFPLQAASVVFLMMLWACVSNGNLFKEKRKEKKKKVIYFGKIISVLQVFRKLLSISSYNQIQVYEVEIRIEMVGFFCLIVFSFFFFLFHLDVDIPEIPRLSRLILLLLFGGW